MSRRERRWDRPVAARRVVSPFAGLWRVWSSRSTPRISGRRDSHRRCTGRVSGFVPVTVSSLLVSRMWEAVTGE